MFFLQNNFYAIQGLKWQTPFKNPQNIVLNNIFLATI